MRALWKAPGFSAVVILTLALGIGINATLFALADAVVFRPFPFADAERLVLAGAVVTDARAEVSYPDFVEWQQRSRSFDGLSAMGLSNWTMTLQEGEPQPLVFRAVSGDWFEVLGVKAAIGRTIDARDDVRGAARTLVLSHGLWQRQFGGQATAIGRTIRVDSEPFTIVGVMPRDFSYPIGAEAWTALVPSLAAIRSPGLPDFLSTRGAGVLHLVGRLKAGMSIDQARQELTPMVSELARVDGGSATTTPRLTSLTADLLGTSRVALLALLAAVGLLLLVALANVAGLVLIRTSRRRTEYAIRSALGASIPALARQLFFEAVALTIVATAVALLLARAVLPVVLSLVPAIPRIDGAAIDGRVIVVAMLAGAVTTLVCSLLPLQGLRGGLQQSLLIGARAVVSAGRTRRARNLLVTAEVALTVVLVTGAALLYRSVARVNAVDLGFDASGLLAVQLERPRDAGADPAQVARFYENAMTSLRTLPDVEAVGAAGSRPLKGPIGLDSSWQFNGQSRDDSQRNPWANFETITPGYFEAMRTPLRQGRLFDDRDRADGERVAIVSESLARFAWPGQSPVGRRLRTAASDRDDVDTWLTVVGVVPDIRYRSLGAVSLDVYVPVSQSPFSAEDVMVRTRGSIDGTAQLIRARLRQLSPAGIVSVDSMAAALKAHQAPWRANLAFFGVFAVLTLLLSAVGLYMVLSYSVGERVREIGVRLTLGAAPRVILFDMLKSGAVLAMAGAAGGVVVSLMLAGSMRALLFDVQPHDVVALAAAPLIVCAIAVTACAVPALRASRVDPIITLRSE